MSFPLKEVKHADIPFRPIHHVIVGGILGIIKCATAQTKVTPLHYRPETQKLRNAMDRRMFIQPSWKRYWSIVFTNNEEVEKQQKNINMQRKEFDWIFWKVAQRVNE